MTKKALRAKAKRRRTPSRESLRAAALKGAATKRAKKAALGLDTREPAGDEYER
jgi:hypothetical protein